MSETTAPPVSSDASADEEQLRFLALFHFGYGAFMGCLGFVMVLLAFALMVNAMAAQRTEEGMEGLLAVGGCVTIVFGVVFLLVTSFAVLHLLLALSLRRRRHYQLCLIAAGVTSMQMPFGAALGIATFIVLLRPTVPPLFGQVVARPA